MSVNSNVVRKNYLKISLRDIGIGNPIVKERILPHFNTNRDKDGIGVLPQFYPLLAQCKLIFSSLFRFQLGCSGLVSSLAPKIELNQGLKINLNRCYLDVYCAFQC